MTDTSIWAIFALLAAFSTGFTIGQEFKGGVNKKYDSYRYHIVCLFSINGKTQIGNWITKTRYPLENVENFKKYLVEKMDELREQTITGDEVSFQILNFQRLEE